MKRQFIARIFSFIVIFSMLLSAVGMPIIQARAATSIYVEGAPVSQGFDSTPSNAVTLTGVATGTGTNRLMLVGISWNGSSSARTISSVQFSYGAGPTVVSLTEVITQKHSTQNRYAAIYRLVNPPSGQTGSVIVTFSGSITTGIVVGVLNFAGVNQTTPIVTSGGTYGNTSTSETSDPTLAVSGLAGNELVFDTLFVGGNPPTDQTPGGGQSLQWDTTIANARGEASTEAATGSSVTMSWSTATSYWVLVAAAINPAATGPTHNLTMSVNPSGAGTTNPGVGVTAIAAGTVVNVTATANTGYDFSAWGGDCSGSGACSVIMSTDHSVTANFVSAITFTGTELLGQPEADRISISCVPASAARIRYQYDIDSGEPYSFTSSFVDVAAGQPGVVTITGLTANTKYYYRMQYSTDGGTTWVSRSQHSFWTKRAAGSTFTFDITSDGHVDIMLGNAATWGNTLDAVAGDQPDFALDLGDSVDMDAVNPGDTSGAETVYKNELPYFNRYSASAPVFLVQGNHEQTEGWHLQAPLTGSLPVIGTNAEKKFFLDPVPDSFYTGDTSNYTPLGGDNKRVDYYAWTWGDALFVVIDPFWFSTSKPYISDPGGGESDATGTGDSWDWTLGLDQFNWLKTTLSGSSAKYKFIFAHQLVGGWPNMSNQNDYGHGGANYAQYVEWGGKNEDGSAGWAANRDTATWGTKPIHQILVDNHVSAFFHGHDHQGAFEQLDGVAYVAVPNGSFNGNFGIYTTGTGYTTWADSNQAAGHLKVTVAPAQTTVDFIRTSTGGTLASYDILPSATITLNVSKTGTGTGTVTSDSGGINCGSTCSANYTNGTSVILTATPTDNYNRFTGWSGTGISCPGKGTCTVSMTAARTVTATFEKSTFGDVPFDHPRWAYIQALYDGGYTSGCSTSPLMFCPENTLTRAESAVFMLRGLKGTSYAPPTEPSGYVFGADDWTPSAISWGRSWAEGMWDEGMTAGCQDSPLMFCPANQLTRVEGSVFGERIKRGISYTPPAATHIFLASEWAPSTVSWGEGWAEQAYNDGLLQSCGTSPLRFCPADLLSRSWAAYIIAKAKNLTLPTP